MKKTIYFIPVICFTILYTLLFFVGAGLVEFLGLVWLVSFGVAGVLLMFGKYWGGVFGLLPAMHIIYVGFQDNGQVISETGIGLIVLIYYVVLSCYVYKNRK